MGCISFESKMVMESGVEKPIPWPESKDSWDQMVYDMMGKINSLNFNISYSDIVFINKLQLLMMRAVDYPLRLQEYQLNWMRMGILYYPI